MKEEQAIKILTTLTELWCDQYGYELKKVEITNEKNCINDDCGAGILVGA